MQLSRAIGQISILLLLTSAATLKATAQDVTCPSIKTMQAAANFMNTATKLDTHSYSVKSDRPAFRENNLNWNIGIFSVYGISESDAIKRAREIVGKIIIRYSNTASERQDTYVCTYSQTTFDLVTATADKGKI